MDENLPKAVLTNHIRAKKMGKNNWRLLFLTNDPKAKYEDIKDKINPNVKFCYYLNNNIHIKRPNKKELDEYIAYIESSLT